MTGRGVAAVRGIPQEVCALIVKYFWREQVKFPTNEEDINESINSMEQLWQASCAFAAVDGCHISITSPPGGAEARREYYNFKIFYSIVLMGMVDAKRRFLWAAVGLPGSVHDATTLQTSKMYQLKDGDLLPQMYNMVNGEKVPPIILGNSAPSHIIHGCRNPTHMPCSLKRKATSITG